MVNNDEALEALDLAIESGDVVLVRTWDERVLLGVPKLHPTEPGVIRILTGSRGRPPQVHRDDVEEVSAP